MASEEQALDSPQWRHDHKWVEQIGRSIEAEFEDSEGIPVSIFTIPKALASAKVEAYAPQQVALGPYHHRRSDLFDMERYKLSSARRTETRLNVGKFRDLVARFMEHESLIRANYYKYLDFDGETLAWMLAVDAAFLLEYLQTVNTEMGASLTTISSNMSHMIDYTGRKLACRAILRDIIMLENQIPLFLLRELLGFHQHENPNKVLAMMVKGLYKVLSPIKAMDDFPSNEEEFLGRGHHLLELLYYTLVPATNRGGSITISIEIEDQVEKQEQEKEGCLREAFTSISNALPCLCSAPTGCIRWFSRLKGMKVMLKLPLQIIGRIRGVATKNRLQNLIALVEEVAEDVDSSPSQMDKTPLVEELTIPSVTQLSNAGIKFHPSKGGLSTIEFDLPSTTFYLPTIDLDENTEVVMRNLISYEASVGPEEMALTRYTDLMKGIIDTEEDVKLLREAGIVLNHLKSDTDVVMLWDSMSKCAMATKVPVFDKAINDINKYYEARWDVRAKRFVKKYLFGSWALLTFLAANILLLLTALETFCFMYNCSRRISSV
ncbi:putative UPF0481 protein At3g02645 [Magnolia sinica]|uniref:putative UPF0481 protein At3g02645 n=1 Tax=Magnolia sinica TaxID=86752 RepID=UPI0026598386|nr:putative UPF0481 protein At3g02645 [Magnolia sinica]